MTRDLKAAYRSDEPMTLDERAEAQRLIVTEYRQERAKTMPAYRQWSCEPNKNMVD